MVKYVEQEEEMVIEGYAPTLAAQVAAVFLIKEGGSMEKVKLTKLLYMVERESVLQRMRPIFYDENFSLPRGPVGTNALDGINGKRDKKVWRKYVATPTGDVVTMAGGLVEDDFGGLSESDLDIIDTVSKRFRHLDGNGMQAWTHDKANVPEYDERDEGRALITDEALAKALGWNDPRAYAEHIIELRTSDRGWVR